MIKMYVPSMVYIQPFNFSWFPTQTHKVQKIEKEMAAKGHFCGLILKSISEKCPGEILFSIDSLGLDN